VNVLRIDRGALTGRLGGVLSNGRIAGREPASAMARRARAVGSTTMTVRGEVVSLPSDPEGERPVSNGVFVLP
jgi:exopolysaccharide biosynthesis protein